MPSSFSRFLAEDELDEVRKLYLESLEAIEEDEAEAEVAEPAPSPSAQADDGDASQPPPSETP